MEEEGVGAYNGGDEDDMDCVTCPHDRTVTYFCLEDSHSCEILSCLQWSDTP